MPVFQEFSLGVRVSQRLRNPVTLSFHAIGLHVGYATDYVAAAQLGPYENITWNSRFTYRFQCIVSGRFEVHMFNFVHPLVSVIRRARSPIDPHMFLAGRMCTGTHSTRYKKAS